MSICVEREGDEVAAFNKKIGQEHSAWHYALVRITSTIERYLRKNNRCAMGTTVVADRFYTTDRARFAFHAPL